MTNIATETINIVETVTETLTTNGEFVNADPVKFGLAKGVPTEFSLVKTKRVTGGKEAITNYHLTITILNEYERPFFGRYGFPYAETERQYDQGYGIAGKISDAPAALLKLVSEVTGCDLSRL